MGKYTVRSMDDMGYDSLTLSKTFGWPKVQIVRQEICDLHLRRSVRSGPDHFSIESLVAPCKIFFFGVYSHAKKLVNFNIPLCVQNISGFSCQHNIKNR